jgi:2-hydroxychromene-2-carboxylate isomerase
VTPHLYKAAWGDNRNIGDKKILVDVLDEAGFDGKALLEGTADPAVKAVLRENTERAQSLGVCGAPTFVVNSDVVIWGQDRIDQVEAALSGWRPADLS